MLLRGEELQWLVIRELSALAAQIRTWSTGVYLYTHHCKVECTYKDSLLIELSIWSFHRISFTKVSTVI
jgi:hypothetical protein